MTTPLRLPASFRRNGWMFSQLRRVGDVVLISKRKPEHQDASYEVAVLEIREAGEVFGKMYPYRECFPPSESWGQRGWSYVDLKSAQQKFDQLVNKLRESCPPTPFPHGAFSSAT